MKHLFLIICSFFITVYSAHATFSFQSHFEDKFTKQEKAHLNKWIQSVGNAVEKTLGKYPFKVHIYFNRSTNKNEPVPWAHTTRNYEEAVHFNVNPSFTMEELCADWTAAHEIAHLSLPYVGKEYSWFAEGYASFFQWQIMFNQGVISKDELAEKYASRISTILPKYDSDSNFEIVALKLKRHFDFPAYYYGGACFFIQLNQSLQDEQSDLAAVISLFLDNGRLNTNSVQEILQQFDLLTKSTVSTDLLSCFETEPARISIGKTSY